MPENPKCSVTRCTNPHDNCHHSLDHRLYCESCAIKINRNNTEHPRLITISRFVNEGMAIPFSGLNVNDLFCFIPEPHAIYRKIAVGEYAYERGNRNTVNKGDVFITTTVEEMIVPLYR